RDAKRISRQAEQFQPIPFSFWNGTCATCEALTCPQPSLLRPSAHASACCRSQVVQPRSPRLPPRSPPCTPRPCAQPWRRLARPLALPVLPRRVLPPRRLRDVLP